jgi:hypothetical protein
MPVPGVLAFIVAAPATMPAVAAMPAVAEKMHGHECARDQDKNPIFRQPFHASTPSMEKFGR